MLRPSSVKFTGVNLSQEDIKDISNAGITTVVKPEWSRVGFVVPTQRDAYGKVLEWLKENCSGQYTVHKFHNTRSYSEYKCVVRFEHPNDAIIFKLSDGHRPWEHKGEN